MQLFSAAVIVSQSFLFHSNLCVSTGVFFSLSLSLPLYHEFTHICGVCSLKETHFLYVEFVPLELIIRFASSKHTTNCAASDKISSSNHRMIFQNHMLNTIPNNRNQTISIEFSIDSFMPFLVTLRYRINRFSIPWNRCVLFFMPLSISEFRFLVMCTTRNYTGSRMPNEFSSDLSSCVWVCSCVCFLNLDFLNLNVILRISN